MYVSKQPKHLNQNQKMVFLRNLKHYWRVYKQIIRFHISLLLEYRLNALVHSLYGFAFMVGVYFGIFVAFTQTETIGGFNQAEIVFMYMTSLFLWSILEATCFVGFRRFMIEDVATGEFDKLLLKPLIPQVLVGISRPDITGFIYTIVTFVLFVWVGFPFFAAASIFEIAAFIIFFIIGLIIHINIFSTYATMAFHMTRSSQIIRTLQSVSDQSFYPPQIYPSVVQFVLFSFVPSAYAAYIPVSILLEKTNLIHIAIACVFLVVILLINRFAWYIGLQRYSSASS